MAIFRKNNRPFVGCIGETPIFAAPKLLHTMKNPYQNLTPVWWWLQKCPRGFVIDRGHLSGRFHHSKTITNYE